VNRPTPVKPDNFFLMIYRALSQRRVPLALRIACTNIFLVALALVIYACVMGLQFKQAMHEQADALGQSLTTQTATSATELLVSNDILSLNVLLGNLVKNPLVAHAAIYSVDNRILAEAGQRPRNSLLGEAEGLYQTKITFQDVTAGQLRISLDMSQFQQPMLISLQSMGIMAAILLALALSLSLRQGRYITLPLLTPVIFFNLIMQMVQAFQEFNGPYIITQGGPLKSTYLLPLYIYDEAFKKFDMGYASAIAWVLFVIIMVLTLIAFWSSKKWVYYAGDKRS